MPTTRLEAFSDGVLAIIITIMVLEMKAPHEPTLAAMKPLWPVILSYLLSFIYVGIYWNNHHHLFQASETLDGSILWANLHLLFWLSLIPFATSWVGETHFAPVPVAMYGAVLLLCGLAYWILLHRLIALHGRKSVLAKAIGSDVKGWLSLVLYLMGIGATFLGAWIGMLIYAAVAVMWMIPDRRIEQRLAKEEIKHEARG